MRRVTIDLARVEDLASCGCTDKEIAIRLGISESTLQRKARAELAKGRAKLRESLRAAQVRVALSGNIAMLIWLGKQYLGQTDRQDVRYTPEELKVVEKIVASQSRVDEGTG